MSKIQWNQTLDDGRTVLEHNLEASGQKTRGEVGLNLHRTIRVYNPVAPEKLGKIAQELANGRAWGPVVAPYGESSIEIQLPLDERGIEQLKASNARTAHLFG